MKKEEKAHRVAWTIVNGPIPPGMCVCHKDESLGRTEVYPNNLFLGTLADNNRDRAKKGRNRDQRGTKHNMAKLNEQDVKDIRWLYASGLFNRKRWAHV